jgi:hypothetical protein
VEAGLMLENNFIIGVGCFILGFALLFFIPKRYVGRGQLAWGSYVMRWFLPFLLIALGISQIAYSLLV